MTPFSRLASWALVGGLVLGSAGMDRAPATRPATRPAASPASLPAVADRATYLAEFCRLAKVHWPKNRTLTVVCHGHSVPAGYFKTPAVRTFDAYPHLLHVALAERFPRAVINVIVTAKGGEASPAGAKRFAADVLPHKPDVVLIDYALNDRRGGLPKAGAAWRSMIEACRAAGIPVVLLTPTIDQGSKLDDADDPLNRHAEQIRRLAVEYGVGLVDSLAVFKTAIQGGTPAPALMSQSNHPNRKGHELVAAELQAWFPRE